MQMMVNECLQPWAVQCLLCEKLIFSRQLSCRRRQHYRLPTRTTFPLGMWAPGLEYPAQCTNCVMTWCSHVQPNNLSVSLLFHLYKWVQRDRLLVMRCVEANQLIECLDPWHDLFLTWIHWNQSFCKFHELWKLCLELFCCDRSKLRGRTGLWGACEGHLGWKRRQQTNGMVTALMKNDHVRTSHLEVH